MQRLVESYNNNSHLLITGGAGTGKTYLISSFIKEFAHQIGNIAVVAPTHSALNVIKNKIKSNSNSIEYRTISALLGFRPCYTDGGEQKFISKHKPVFTNYNLIVIDEASMINKAQFKILKNNLDKIKMLVLLGDPYQLPPINENHSKIFTYFTNILHLETIHRTSDNLLLQVYCIFRDAVVDDKLKGMSPEHYNRVKKKITCKLIQEIADQYDFKILAYKNITVKNYNSMARYALFGITEHPYIKNEKMYFKQTFITSLLENFHASLEFIVNEVSIEEVEHPWGESFECYVLKISCENEIESVLNIATDKKKYKSFIKNYRKTIIKNLLEIYTLTIKSCKTSTSVVSFIEKNINHLKHYEKYLPILHEIITYSNNFNDCIWNYYNMGKQHFDPPIDYAYSMTIHKAQGKTYDAVMIDVNDIYKSTVKNIDTRKKLLYTGVSRASQKLLLCK